MTMTRIAADTLITGACLVTMDATRRILADGALAMAGDRIVAVGPSAEVEAAVTARTRIDARGKLVTPGLVNGHVHLTETLIRGFIPEDLDFAEGLFGWVIRFTKRTAPKNRRSPRNWQSLPC
jgi:cytosine/adenosine deaminase-related metal-dependent hydrolase